MVTKSQEARIKEQVLKFQKSQGALAKKEAAFLTECLEQASSEVHAELQKLGTKPWQKMRREILTEMQYGLARIGADLKKNMAVNVVGDVEAGLTLGIQDGLGMLQMLDAPAFKALSPPSANMVVMRMFSVIDRSAIDMMAQYRIQLVGDVADQLVTGIQKSITVGILTGKSIQQIAGDIGTVVTDKDKFKQAGKTLFKTAQQRAKLIAHTEVQRAHNEGRKKFYEKVGVTKVEWLTAPEDGRRCSICAGLNGKIFETGKAPGPPRHPDCRCTVMAVIPDDEPMPDIPLDLAPTAPMQVQPPVEQPVAPKTTKTPKAPKKVKTTTPVAPPAPTPAPVPPKLPPLPPVKPKPAPVAPVVNVPPPVAPVAPKTKKPKPLPPPPPPPPPAVPKIAPGVSPKVKYPPPALPPAIVPPQTRIRLSGGFADDAPVGGLATEYLLAKDKTPMAQTLRAQANAFMRSSHVQWVDRLTSHQKHAIRNYTGIGYGEMNNHLRKKVPIDDHTKAQIGHIDLALRQSRLQHPLDVYRGMSRATSNYYQKQGWFKPGAVFDDPGFGSTSLTPSTPVHSFSGDEGVIMRVRLRTGQAVGMIGNHDTYGSPTRALTDLQETEAILPKGTKFRVLDYKYVKGTGAGMGRHVIDVEVLDE